MVMEMKTYKLTAYEADGTVLFDESIEAANDSEAKQKGEQFVAENNLEERTHRLASPTGKLILFHS